LHADKLEDFKAYIADSAAVPTVVAVEAFGQASCMRCLSMVGNILGFALICISTHFVSTNALQVVAVDCYHHLTPFAWHNTDTYCTLESMCHAPPEKV
jgi:hypothetical protein